MCIRNLNFMQRFHCLFTLMFIYNAFDLSIIIYMFFVYMLVLTLSTHVYFIHCFASCTVILVN